MNHTAALVSLATSIPPYQFHQNQILQAAHGLLADRYPQFETLSSLFANTGIRHRYGVKPLDWYLERLGWPERTQAFLEGAEAAVRRRRAQGARARRSARPAISTPSSPSPRPASPRPASRRASPANWASVPTSSACRCSVWAAPAAFPACRSRRAWRRRGPARTCSWWRSSSARCLPHGPADQRQHRRDGLFGDGAAACVCAPARRRDADRSDGRASVARHARHHGLERRSEGFGVIFERTIPDFAARAFRRRGRRNPRAHAAVERGRCRSLHLPSRRRQGDHRAGGALSLDQGTLDHERECSPTTATCRRRPCCSCSTARWRGRPAAHGRC